MIRVLCLMWARRQEEEAQGPSEMLRLAGNVVDNFVALVVVASDVAFDVVEEWVRWNLN